MALQLMKTHVCRGETDIVGDLGPESRICDGNRGVRISYNRMPSVIVSHRLLILEYATRVKFHRVLERLTLPFDFL